MANSDTAIEIDSLSDEHQSAIGALHRYCGIYTAPNVVRRILDAVAWSKQYDLSRSRLLEPAAGNGEFLVEAARRLVASFRLTGKNLSIAHLRNRILAFELHPEAANEARSRIVEVLRNLKVHHRTAEACATSWVIHSDFLLTDLTGDGFTHAVGNPPYIRWSKVPSSLKSTYEKRLPREMTGGDLFLPFLDRALEQLRPNGRCGFLCSDRWRFMAFADSFRQKWLPALDVISEDSLNASDAFTSAVDAYPNILIATKRLNRLPTDQKKQSPKPKTLGEMGYSVRVGPALGHTPAFVLHPHEKDVEPELLYPWINGSEIAENAINWRGRRVIATYDNDGKLIDLEDFPLLASRLARFRANLRNRAIVRNGAPWYRTIDRVFPAHWKRPKLVIPELAKIPRVAIDRSGAIPSHGVYSIFAPNDDIDALYEKLRDGKLAHALQKISPRVKGEYLRCYKRFLSAIPLGN